MENDLDIFDLLMRRYIVFGFCECFVFKKKESYLVLLFVVQSGQCGVSVWWCLIVQCDTVMVCVRCYLSVNLESYSQMND